jgi:hypothetical protein
MEVRRLCWLGVRAPDVEAMVLLLRDLMGLEMEFAEAHTVELSLPSGDRIQVFGPGHAYHDFLGSQSQRLVPLFQVEYLRRAKSELEGGGIEVFGSIEGDRDWEWVDFRAPDGNLYELGSHRRGP